MLGSKGHNAGADLIAGLGLGAFAAGGGMLGGAAMLYGVWWSGLVALVPLLLITRNAGGGRGFLLGLAWGAGLWSVAVWWTAVGLWSWNDAMPWRAALSAWGLFLYQAVPYAVFGWWHGRATRAARRAGGRGPGVLRTAAALTVLVWWFPTVVPGTPVNTLALRPVLIQVLELGGMPLLYFLVALSGALLARGIASLGQMRGREAGRDAVLAVAVVAAVWAYGAVRMPMVEQAEQARIGQGARQYRVAMVQPDMPIESSGMVFFTGRGPRLHGLPDAAEQVRRAASGHPDLIVLPELPVWLECWSGSHDMRRLAGAANATRTPLLLSCGQSRQPPPPDGAREASGGYYNCAAMVRPDQPLDPAAGLGAVYHKRVLVPFGEYIPFENTLPFLRRFMPGAKQYLPGGGDILLAADGLKAAPLLCYEVHFSEAARQQRLAGANVLANLADIAWFGPTGVTTLHTMLARCRSVELRMPLVMVNNAGPTMAVDSLGRIAPGTTLPLGRAGISTATVLPAGPLSPFARYGDLFLYLLTAVWVLRLPVALVVRRERRF